METFSKDGDSILVRTKDREPAVDTFNYDFLLSQKKALEASLAEVDGLLSEADKLGCKKASDIIKEI